MSMLKTLLSFPNDSVKTFWNEIRRFKLCLASFRDIHSSRWPLISINSDFGNSFLVDAKPYCICSSNIYCRELSENVEIFLKSVQLYEYGNHSRSVGTNSYSSHILRMSMVNLFSGHAVHRCPFMIALFCTTCNELYFLE